MNDVTTKATPINATTPVSDAPDQIASADAAPKLVRDTADLDYPPLEMAEPLVFWYNPFTRKKS